MVPDLYEAWHAGKSSWKKIRFLNKYSIGIEIHNQGHNFKYEKFSFKQIITIMKTSKEFKAVLYLLVVLGMVSIGQLLVLLVLMK